MADARRSPPDDDPADSPPSTHPSFCGPDGDDDMNAAAFLLGPRVLRSPVVSDFGSDEDDDSWAGDRRSPPDDDPDASPPSAHHSGQSSSACGPDGDAKIKNKTAAAFLLGPRVLGSPVASDFDSDEDDDSWVGFSDRTGGGASTSTSSPDAYDPRTFFGDTASFPQMHDQASQTGSSRIFEKEPLSLLESEFVYKAMKDKSKMLLANYSAYRKVLGDGSCFYRSFIYSYLEQLVKASPDEELRLLHALEPMWEKFQRLNWPDSYSDAYNAFVGLILECMQQRQTLSVSDYEDWLFQEIQNEEKFTGTIEICTKPEKFRDHIDEQDRGNPDLVWYCRKKVIPMHAEADQVVLIALTDVLRVPLRIVNIDISGISEPNTHIIYESPTLPLVPSVTLLYRPGHYDILYQ